MPDQMKSQEFGTGLVLNIGSSTIKFGLHPLGPPGADGPGPLLSGKIEGIGLEPAFVARTRDGTALDRAVPDGVRDTGELTRWLLDVLRDQAGDTPIRAAGHRVVHGGADFANPVRIDDTVLVGLEKLVPLAPGHQPHNLAGIRAVAGHWPDIPQVACFDTAFHHTRPRLARLYALPREEAEAGILRYGFHGLSYAHIARRLPGVLGPERADGRVIVAHLGSGVSLCGMVERRSQSTTMGFTALDGVMMGTRSGQIDPGVVLHLIRARGMSADAVEALLSKRSGLLGVSGLSPDMRDLLASDDPAAQEAVELFVRSVTHHVGAVAADIGGIDALVFTAGIGEHAAPVRARIGDALGWLGLSVDAGANRRHEAIVSTPESRVAVAVIATDEEAEIAAALRADVDATTTGGGGRAGAG